VTLRERIAQTAYWKLKLSADPVTKNIRTLFVTPDEDGALVRKLPTTTNRSRGFKGRIIVEYDTDGAYVLREIEESEKVRTFPKLMEDIRKIVNERKRNKK
jgi:type II restriction enzyme